MKKFLLSLLLVLAIAVPLVALAQTDGPIDSGTTLLPNPLGNAVTPAELAARVINILLGVVGVAALVVFIYGGVQYMFSGGNSQKVQSAKDTIVYATLGIAIILASRSLLQFVMKAIVGATGVQ